MDDLTIRLPSRNRKWIALTFVANLALFSAGVYLFVRSSRLSLPISRWLLSFTIILPLVNLAAFSYAITRAVPAVLTKIHTTLSTVFLLMLDTVVVTLSGNVLTKSFTECMYEYRWTEMFRAKDGPAIRGIQDSLDCCGYRTLNHMAYPLPPRNVTTCAQETKRTHACSGPWTQAGQSTAEMVGGICIVLAIAKVLAMYYIHNHHENTVRAAEAASRGRIQEVHSDEEDGSGSDEEEQLPRAPPNGNRKTERTPLLVEQSPWAEENGRGEGAVGRERVVRRERMAERAAERVAERAAQ